MQAIGTVLIQENSAQPQSTQAPVVLRPYLASDALALRELLAQLDWGVAASRQVDHQVSLKEPAPSAASSNVTPAALNRVWVVTRPEDGRAVGCLGLEVSPLHRTAQLHLTIAAGQSRRGYGRGAAAAVVELAHKMGLERVAAEVMPANLPARKILQAMGMQLEGRLRGHRIHEGQRVDTLCYGMLLPELGK